MSLARSLDRSLLARPLSPSPRAAACWAVTAELAMSRVQQLLDKIVNETTVTLLAQNIFLTQPDLARITEALCTNQSIKNLYLGNNDLGDAGCLLVANLLRVNRQIQHVYLDVRRVPRSFAEP